MATEQEQIEKVALEYANQIVLEAQDSPEYFAFIHGVEWQKEQSATDASEFAEWLDIATKQSENRCFIERTEGYSYSNLYKLWLKTKENADN